VIAMEKPDENRVPKIWVGREVVVRTRGPGERGARMVGRLEDVHEGGVVLSRIGPTPEVAELGPVLFYSWSAVEELRLRVAPPDWPDRRGTREEPHDRTRALELSRRFESITAQTLDRVVPIVQRRSAAGITVALSALEIHEGDRGLIGYLLAPDSELGDETWDRLVRYSFPEVRVRDDRGCSYEAGVGSAVRAWGGKLRVADLPEAGAAELEVEVVRLFKGPSGEGRNDSLDGPWVFRFPCRYVIAGLEISEMS
jgi:hypothetical protein